MVIIGRLVTCLDQNSTDFLAVIAIFYLNNVLISRARIDLVEIH